MKKVLIVAKSLGGGGSETAIIEFINHLSSKNMIYLCCWIRMMNINIA